MSLVELTNFVSAVLPDDAPVSGFLQAVVIAAGTALTGAITYLFKQVMYLSRKQAALSLEIGELKGRQAGIQDMSSEVLKTVHNAIRQLDEEA